MLSIANWFPFLKRQHHQYFSRESSLFVLKKPSKRVYLYKKKRTLFFLCLVKEKTVWISSNEMDETGAHYTQWSKPGR